MGDRFLSRERPAWHGLGVLFPEDEVLAASEAVKRVAGDVKVVTCPVSYELDGAARAAKDKVAVVRRPTADSPEPELFGVVGGKWRAEPYHEMARALDKLAETYRVETAGLLRGGRLCFLGLKGSGWDVAGDAMESYFVTNLSLEPGTGHRVMHTPVRVVCWNTNNAALGSASINLSIPHNADAKQQLGIAGDLVARFAEAQAKTKEVCEAFAAREVTVGEAERVFAAAYPEPRVPKKIEMLRGALGTEGAELFKGQLSPAALQSVLAAEDNYEKAVARSRDLRVAVRERYHEFDPARLRGTAWAAYNAVTEVADWREGPRAAESSMWGTRSREKSRAFAEALGLVEA
jgi:hypothetical protein